MNTDIDERDVVDHIKDSCIHSQSCSPTVSLFPVEETEAVKVQHRKFLCIGDVRRVGMICSGRALLSTVSFCILAAILRSAWTIIHESRIFHPGLTQVHTERRGRPNIPLYRSVSYKPLHHAIVIVKHRRIDWPLERRDIWTPRILLVEIICVALQAQGVPACFALSCAKRLWTTAVVLEGEYREIRKRQNGETGVKFGTCLRFLTQGRPFGECKR